MISLGLMTVGGVALGASPLEMTEKKVCQAAQVVVLGVVKDFGEVFRDTQHGGGVFTRRKFETGVAVFGTPPAEIPFEIPGDWVDHTVTVVGVPDWSVGSRHLLVLHYVEETERIPGGWVRVVDKVIPAGMPLPPAGVMAQMFAEHCAEHRPDVDAVSGTPTQNYLDMLGLEGGPTCEHY